MRVYRWNAQKCRRPQSSTLKYQHWCHHHEMWILVVLCLNIKLVLSFFGQKYMTSVFSAWSRGSGLVSFFTSSGAQRVRDWSAQRHWRSSYFWGENLSPACWVPTLLTLHLWSRRWFNLKWCLFLTSKDINRQHLLHRCKAIMCEGNLFSRRVFLNQYTRVSEYIISKRGG